MPEQESHGQNSPEAEKDHSSSPDASYPSEQSDSSERSGTPTVIITRTKRSVVDRLTRILLTIAAVILILILTAVILTQTSFVRKIVVDQLVKAVDSSTNGHLSVGRLEGNLFSGFVLRDVHLKLNTNSKYDSVEVMHADEVIAHYSLIRFLRTNDLGITSAVVINPVFQMVRFTGDTVWSLSRLFKTAAQKQGKPSKPMVVDLQSVRIQNGRFYMQDYNDTLSVAPTIIPTGLEPLRQMNFRHLDLTNINADARFYTDGNAQSLRLNSLAAVERVSGFILRHLELSAYRDSLQLRVEEGHLYTDRTDIRFAASLGSIHKLQFSSLHGVESHLRLNAPLVSTAELRAFVPSLRFMAGSPALDVTSSGTFDNLHVDHLLLDLHNEGSIAINGAVRRLDSLAAFNLDLNLSSRDISERSFRAYIPGLNIPDLSRLGVIQVRQLHFVGPPKNFASTLDVLTSAGDVKGKAAFDFFQSPAHYSVDLATNSLNLGTIVGKSSLSSDLNVHLLGHGVGMNPKTMTASIVLHTDRPSSFGKYAVSSLDVTALIERGVVHTDHLLVHLPDGTRANITHASFEFAAPHAYAVSGTVDSLPLANYVTSLKNNSAKLSAVLDSVEGVGLDLEKITGTAQVRLSDLAVAGEPLDDILADLAIQHGANDSENVVSIKSALADITMQGQFGLIDVGSVLPERLGAVTSAFANRYFPNRTDSLAPPHSPLPCDPIDFTFDVRLKDLRPLSGLIPNTLLLATGVSSGRVHGCADDELNLEAKGSLLEFVLRPRHLSSDSTFGVVPDSMLTVVALHDSLAKSNPSSGTRIQLTPTTFDLTLAHMLPDAKEVLDVLDAHLAIRSDSVVRYNSILVQRPNLRFDYRDRAARYRLWSIFGGHYGILVDGSANFPQNQFLFNIDTLRFALGRGYRWQTEHPARLSYSTTGEIKVDSLALEHLEPGDIKQLFTEHLELDADVQHDSIRYAHLRVPNLKLSELPLILPNYSKRLPVLEGYVRKLDLNAKGSFAAPVFDALVELDHLKYNQMTFDTSFARVHYANATLSGSAQMHVDSLQFAIDNFADEHALSAFSPHNTLKLTVDSIPMLLALAHGPNYSTDSAQIQKRTLSASLETYHFPIDLAGPFIPSVDQLTGFGDISFKLGGTFQNVKFDGSAKIVDGSFRLPATNVSYTFDGKLAFADSVLRIENVVLKNVPYDDPAGEASVEGAIYFKGLSMDQFDVTAKTNRLAVLTTGSRKVMKTLYGPLIISTQGGQLRFYGSAKSPLLEGNLGIVSADITIPQGQSQARTTGDGIIYRPFSRPATFTGDSAAEARQLSILQQLRDTSMRTAILDSLLFPKQDIYAEGSTVDMSPSDSTILAANMISSRPPPPTILDRMRYNVNLAISGDVWIAMIMNRLYGFLGEQLRAELKTGGPFSIVRGADGIFHINGDLIVTENSSYNFYKTFSPASGTISFHDDASNPDINITAEYIGPHLTGEVMIKLIITGTEHDPHLAMEIYESKGVGGEFQPRVTGSQADIQEDVLYYLVSGSFKGELTPGQQLSVLEKASTALGSSFATSLLNNVLGNTGLNNIIRSVNFELGGNLTSSRLKLTAAYKNIVFRYGSSGLGNPLDADYTVEVPFSFFSTSPWAQHLLFDFNYHSPIINEVEAVQQPNYVGKFLWRFPLY